MNRVTKLNAAIKANSMQMNLQACMHYILFLN